MAFVNLSNLSLRILFNFESVILLFKFLIASEMDLYILDGLNFLFNSVCISFNSLVFLILKFLAFFNICFLPPVPVFLFPEIWDRPSLFADSFHCWSI